MEYLTVCESQAHGYDIEIRGTQVDCISFSYSSDHAISIPFTENNTNFWSVEEELEIWLKIAKVLQGPSPSIAHNTQFDSTFLYNIYGIRVNNVHDTMLMTQLVYPDFNIGLDFVTSIWSDIAYYKDDGKYRTKQHDKVLVEGKTFDEQFWLYNAKDSIVLMDVWPKLLEELKSIGNLDKYEFCRSMYPAMTYMSSHGILMDEEGLKDESLEADQELLRIALSLRKEIKLWSINPSSSKQLKEYFYGPKSEGGLAIKPYIDRKTGNPTVNKDALKRMAIRGFDAANICLKYNELEKMKGTYYDMWLHERRLKCSLFFTRTGRFRSSKTLFGYGANMQNQPWKIKKYMLPDPGYVLFDGDLGQAENRIVAYVSGDTTMMHAFDQGLDIHSYTASFILNKEYEEVSREKDSHPFLAGKSERDLGKQANHALNYGMGPATAAFQWMMRLKDVKPIHAKYHATYRGVKRWQKLTEQKLGKTKTLTNLYGMTYTFWQPWGSKLFLEANAFVPQSSIADHINMFGLMPIWSDPLYEEVEILNQVHDSLVFQIPLSAGWDYISTVLSSLTTSLEREIKVPNSTRSFNIPFEIDMCGRNLLDAKGLEDYSPEVLKEIYNGLMK